MTGKTCNNNTHGVALDSVCNEIYGKDHNSLRRCKTVAHQKFTRGNSRFLHIDDLYRSDSTITKLFLKINDIALNESLNGLRSSSHPIESSKSTTMTRNRLLRQQTSMYDKLKSPASPTSSESCCRLRPRRHTTFVNNFVDSSGDDDSNHVRPMRELRSSTKLLTAVNTPEPLVWDSGRPKRLLKQKRLSLNEEPINNKNDFNPRVTRNNLKRASKNSTNKPRNSLVKTSLSDSEDEKVPVISKKVYISKLATLNNEAENFLFPKVRDYNSSPVNSEEYSKDDERKGSGLLKYNKNFKYPYEEESMDSTSSDTSYSRKKRRLTQAEAFILDNQQYYRFETPGSRLRYHGSYLPPVVVTTPSATSTNTPRTTAVSTNSIIHKNNGDIVSKQVKNEPPAKKVTKKHNLERLKFSFESIPSCEAWYDTFQRLDHGEERYTSCNRDLSVARKIFLPYELPPRSLAPINPRLCYYAYQELRKSLLESPSSRHGNCSTPNSLDTTSKTDDFSTGDDTRSSADFHVDLDSPFRRETRNSHLISSTPCKTPRKSPRQHASTLAILSSLIHTRRRKPKNILPPIEEEKGAKPDYYAIQKFFDSCLEDLDSVAEEPEAIDFNVHCKPSAVQTLEDYLNEFPKSSSKFISDRKAVRKKRTNRTGWPNKSKRPSFKKEGSHSSGSIIEATTDNCSINNAGDVGIENKINGVETDKTKLELDSEVELRNCVNVDLAKWENAEKVLTAKLHAGFQPVVCLQKLANNVTKQNLVIQCSRPATRNKPTPSKPSRLIRHRN